MILKNKKGFTLIEMILVVTLFAIIIVIAFEAMGNIAVFRTRLSSRLDIEQDLYYSMETLSSQIKDFGGDIDYEEYWGRQMMGITVGSGHYSNFTGFGNYGSGGTFGSVNTGEMPYLCRSGSGVTMGTGGCASNSYNTYGAPAIGKPQRYGQYALQFIDYNSNKDNDLGKPGDEDGDWQIQGDDDDENLGQGPEAFTGNKVQELYLIRKGKTNERMLLRLNIIQDPSGGSLICNFTTGNGDGCLGKLQILKLTGKDYGYDHNITTTTSVGDLDGIIDTWICNSDYYCSGTYKIPMQDEGWIDILPSYINVKNIKFYIYPKKDYKLDWSSNNTDANINPYVKINITLGYAWERKKILKGINPEINLTTTINLTKN